MSEVAQNEKVIAKVGERFVTTSDLLAFLIQRQHWSLVDRLVDQCLISQEAEKLNVEVTQDELRQQLTVIRQQKGLLSSADMHKFLESHHMSESDFLEMCRMAILSDKLKEALFKDKVAEYFAQRRLELAQVELYKIAVSSEGAADEIIDSLRDGMSFFELAYRHSTDEESRKKAGYMGSIAVHTLDPKLQELLVGRSEGTVVGPVKVAKGYQILLIGAFHAAEFDGDTRKRLLSELLDQWLSMRRQRGEVQSLI